MKPAIGVAFLICLVLSVVGYTVPPEAFYPLSGSIIQLIRASALILALVLLFEKILNIQLLNKILLGMILGILLGLQFGAQISEVKPVGTAFLRLIQMIVVPLVLASLIVGTASLGDPKKLGRIGMKTFAYYLSTTALAITIGLLMANIFQPGSGLSPEAQAQLLQNYQGQASEKMAQMGKTSIVDTILNIIPTNPIDALSSGKMLQIIFFAIFTGIALTIIPQEKSRPVIAFFDGLNEAMLKIVLIAIKIAPYGVFALIADAVGSFGLDIIITLLKYTLVTTAGLLIMASIYPFIARTFSGISPIKYLKAIRPAQIIAFSTSSSGATLPVTMEVSEENLGVSNNIASFVLPLGATVNMDGTALYQGVASVFIAQVYGIHLGVGDQLMIVLTATLASIGTAAAPGVGLLMLVMILKQVGIPLEGIALILSVDRLLDMFRTVINVTSDLTASVVVASTENQIQPPEELRS
ncbi:MAG: dicarboxylate/amino acid:cation symporter [Calditrichaeota bacterium]|nr:dicarboxylate/amino acid:cation symporter [Calditrichota bacterium]